MRVEYRDSVLTREQSASAVPTRFTTNRHSSLRSSQGRACASSGEDPDGVAHSAGGEERSTPRSYGEKTSSWTPSRVSIRRSARSGRLFVMTRSNLATFRPSWGRATVSSVRSKLPEKGGRDSWAAGINSGEGHLSNSFGSFSTAPSRGDCGCRTGARLAHCLCASPRPRSPTAGGTVDLERSSLHDL